MPRFLPLNATQHRHAAWLPYDSYSFAAHDTLVPLVADELAHALPVLPLAFRQRPGQGGNESSAYELVAVQSLTPNLNLFVHPDGRWLGGYIPAYYRGYPFRMLPMPDSQRLALCIDLDSGLLLEQPNGDGQRLFDDEGAPSEQLSRIKTFHEKLEVRRRPTQRAVDVLAENSLIVPWEVQAKGEEGESLPVKGIYRIDEAALNALPADALAAVQKAGGLTLAYAQLFSQHRLSTLSRLYRLRQEFSGQTPDLETLFGDEDDVSFDFDS